MELGQFRQVEDHPRIRGEKIIRTISMQLEAGSPPHTRGKEAEARLLRGLIRITPAYAGKSLLFFIFMPCKRDHPRIRGEKTKKIPLYLALNIKPIIFHLVLKTPYIIVHNRVMLYAAHKKYQNTLPKNQAYNHLYL